MGSAWRLFFSDLDVGTEHLAVVFVLAGDVKPIGAGRVSLEKKLVETAVFEDELGIALAGGLVGQADVGGFSRLVLGAWYASYELVEFGTTVAGVNHDGAVCPQPQRLQYLLAEVLQVADCLQRRGVADAVGLGNS